jgi:hydroxymethylglutaryl-CoA reductase
MIMYDFPKLYKRTVAERLNQLQTKCAIDVETSKNLLRGKSLLSVEQADKMIENVVGVFGLPVGLGLNFLVNAKEYIVPMVVEEPSIAAAVSSAAKIVRNAGGFKVYSSEMLLTGQVVVTEIADASAAGKLIFDHKEKILALANSLHPKMVARGGGAIDIEINYRRLPRSKKEVVVAHLWVDSKDAMGANLVNSMCEGVAALIEKITGGKVLLQILSNLYDRSIIRAEACIPCHLLAGKGSSPEEVRDRIATASEFAEFDRHRAVTHNKGIMNGIDNTVATFARPILFKRQEKPVVKTIDISAERPVLRRSRRKLALTHIEEAYPFS